MRVITGTARGRRLLSLPGLDTRPTSEIVKEAVFSIIQMEIPGASVLDLFAGSGQMGIEALSRGAASCVLVDNSKKSCRIIHDNLASTGLLKSARIEAMDVNVWLKTARGMFDIAFIDPPYESGLLVQALPAVAKIMRGSSAILCESSKTESLLEETGGFVKKREYIYGKTKITLYRASVTTGSDII